MSSKNEPSAEESIRTARRWAKISGITALCIAALMASNTVMIVFAMVEDDPAIVLTEAYSEYVDAFNAQRNAVEALQNQVAALEDLVAALEEKNDRQERLIEAQRRQLAACARDSL